MTDVHVAIAVVRDAQDRFLVGKRTEGSDLAGYDEFPGGKVESGEAPADAAVRECLEESGLSVSAAECLFRVHHKYDHAAVHLEFFACEPLADAVLRGAFRWVARQELASCKFPAANADLVEKLIHDSL